MPHKGVNLPKFGHSLTEKGLTQTSQRAPKDSPQLVTQTSTQAQQTSLANFHSNLDPYVSLLASIHQIKTYKDQNPSNTSSIQELVR